MFVSITEARELDDRRAVYRFRYRVLSEEAPADQPGFDHDLKEYVGEIDRGSRMLVAVARETRSVVGSLSIWFGKDRPFHEDLERPLGLSRMVNAFGRTAISYTQGLTLDPAVRGKTVASLLVGGMYKLARREGVTLDTCSPELSSVQLYHQLGYRPYARPFRRPDMPGLQVPLVLTLTDGDYLKRSGSPFRAFLELQDDDGGRVARQLSELYEDFALPALAKRDARALWACLAQSTQGERMGLFEGIPAEQWTPLVTRFPTLKLNHGERVHRMGENTGSMGLLVRGRLGVTLDDSPDPHYVAVISPGEPFGELGFLLGRNRTANLVALEESEVAMLSESFFENIDEMSSEAGGRIRHNMLRLFAKRLQDMNRMVAALRPRPAETLAPKVMPEARVSQVTFDAAEVVRHEKTVQATEELESMWLRRAGVREDATILHVYSGAGFATTGLARAFPKAQLVGVEPSKPSRDAAVKRARQLELGERCVFAEVEGTTLRVDERSVDVAYVRLSLRAVQDRAALFRELRRVTKRGGLVVAMDIDEGGVLLEPEPDGYADFCQVSEIAADALGAKQEIGRMLPRAFRDAGLESVTVEICPLSPPDTALESLIELGFGPRMAAIRRTSVETRESNAFVERLSELPDVYGAWMMVPVFFVHGRNP